MPQQTAESKHAVIFSVDRTPPSLNVMLRTPWKEGSRLQKLWEVWVWKEWVKHNRFVFTVPVKVSYVLSFKRQRNRDIDNYIGGTKLITDALKQTFFTRDDSNWLQKIEVEFLEGPEKTSILIEEA